MRHALGRVVVVVIHVDDYFAARLFVHQVAFLSERNFIREFEIPHAFVMRHEVFNGIGAVVHDDPLHAVAGIRLMVETLQHGGNERTTVERGSAHADHDMIR